MTRGSCWGRSRPCFCAARAVEDLLEGQGPGDALARAARALAARALAAREAQPLTGNRFKVEVLKSLVRRAVGMQTAGEQ